jgi:hypothetical protein
MTDFFNKYVFDIPIVNAELEISEEESQKYIYLAYEISKEDACRETNLTGLRSNYDLHLRTKEFNKLLNCICNKINEFIPYEFFFPKSSFEKKQKSYLKLEDSWCGVYNKDSMAKYHMHNPAHVSFCYYLQTDENSSPIIFDQLKFSIQPKKNHIIAFPGFLGHRVPIQKKHKLDRVILAGNLRYIGSFA